MIKVKINKRVFAGIKLYLQTARREPPRGFFSNEKEPSNRIKNGEGLITLPKAYI